MSENCNPEQVRPTIGGSLIIRTYADNIIISESESEPERELQDDSDDEGNISSALRLDQNKEFMDKLITPPTNWILLPQTTSTPAGVPIILIKKPTASAMSYRVLHPFLYRKIKDVGSLNDMARLLRSPSDWEDIYARIMEDGRLYRFMDNFRELPVDAPESRIQSTFNSIVGAISIYLNVGISSMTDNGVMIGGLLAQHEYDHRCATDLHISNYAERVLFSTECKTHMTFRSQAVWYRDSRGVQVFSALYAYNAPVFLYSHRQWKIFLENDERNSVFTFPFEHNPQYSRHANSLLVEPMGSNFLKAVVICLLSARQTLSNPLESTKVVGTPNVGSTPGRNSVKVEDINSPLKKKPRPGFPSFESGNVDGKPVYSVIRVLPPDEVARRDKQMWSDKELSEPSYVPF